MTTILCLALVLGVLWLALLGLSAVGRSRWAELTRALLGHLEAGRLPASPWRYDVRELEGLPAPVQRYFQAVLKPGQSRVAAVTFRQTGHFNLNAFGRRALWIPFASRQRVTTNRPGFVWDACMVALPGLEIRVHDAYLAGLGTLHPSVLGLFSLQNQHGGGALARGELMRYMMEATWYPTALLPSQGTTWVAVDDGSADATMADSGIRMTMRFRFGPDGLIESVHADARGAMMAGQVVLMPWEGRMSNYQERAGMRVPLTGEAAWLSDGSRKPYWRGTLTSAHYEWAE